MAPPNAIAPSVSNALVIGRLLFPLAALAGACWSPTPPPEPQRTPDLPIAYVVPIPPSTGVTPAPAARADGVREADTFFSEQDPAIPGAKPAEPGPYALGLPDRGPLPRREADRFEATKKTVSSAAARIAACPRGGGGSLPSSTCVCAAVCSLRFAPEERPVVVRYPFQDTDGLAFDIGQDGSPAWCEYRRGRGLRYPCSSLRQR